ncbi:MAG: GH3 auxin-responsive promoter family protein [Gemmatimonadota bacterium]|nr:GH3 auxin-responsive promoter family protein [Gemmatimonadota bacterium]
MSTAAWLANRLYLAAAAPAHARFRRALRDPEQAQRAILRELVRRNARTTFGREHGFDRIASVQDFQNRVPLRDYDGYAEYTDRIGVGEASVLTSEPVRFVEPSGGSSGPSKEVPYTGGLLREFSAATLPWVFDLLWSRPRLRGGRAYWAISPPARRAARTPGGIPVGMEHDSDYFPAPVRGLLDRMLGVPRAVSLAPDVATARYLTLRALLATPDLALVSVWSPSFLSLLMTALDEHWAALLRDLDTGELSVEMPAGLRGRLTPHFPAHPARASALLRRFRRTAPEDLGALWTRLALISCWTDGHARRALGAVRRRFPHVEIQGKGLLATEGVVSFPLFDADAPVAAVTSHFLEFLPVSDPEAPRLVHQLERGGIYEVVLSTGGGLYRYRLGDRVRVEGHLHRTPLLSFVGRADRASDLAGEKLTAPFVEQVLARATMMTGVEPVFAMLAPAWGAPPRYLLYAELAPEEVRRLAEAVEGLLSESHHYALCRALGQLGPVQGVSVRDGERTHERVCVRRGQRAGSIKPAALDPGLEWADAFGVGVAVAP